MKAKLAILILLSVTILSLAAQAQKQSLETRTEQSIVGTWKGKFGDVPAIEVALKLADGKLTGVAIFYQVENTDAGPAVKGKEESPLIDPALHSNVLSFKVKRNDGSDFAAKMRFTGDDEALLKPADDPESGDDHAMHMTREK